MAQLRTHGTLMIVRVLWPVAVSSGGVYSYALCCPVIMLVACRKYCCRLLNVLLYTVVRAIFVLLARR